MRVTCPNCATVYNLPDQNMREGAKLRCTVCKHVFPLLENGVSDLGQSHRSLNQDFDQQAEASRGDFGKPVPRAPDGDMGSLFDELQGVSDEVSLSREERRPPPPDAEFLALGDGEDLSFNLDASRRKKGRGSRRGAEPASRKSSLPIFFVLFLVVAGTVGYLYWDKIEPHLSFLRDHAGEEQGDGAAAQLQEALPYNFSFTPEPEHFYMDNTKAGRIFVIQGSVVNDYDAPKELIKVEAQLLDAAGEVLDSKAQLIGNTVSHYQLEVLSQEELEAAVNYEVGVLMSNTNVPPGGSVPFVIVFYNPPEDRISEYVLEVVEAKDPPR